MNVIDPIVVIEKALGNYIRAGVAYPTRLPPDLQRWHVYTMDGGHNIVCVREEEAGVIDSYPHLIWQHVVPVPVRTVLRLGHRTVNGIVVVSGVHYDPQVGLVVPGEDSEFVKASSEDEHGPLQIMVQNGQEFPSTVVATNYFATRAASLGLCYLSWNNRTARLLVPQPTAPQLVAEIGTPLFAVISYDGSVYDIMFEDRSEAPYGLVMSAEASDRRIPAGDDGRADLSMIVYGPGLKELLRLSARFRRVRACPDRRPWGTT